MQCLTRRTRKSWQCKHQPVAKWFVNWTSPCENWMANSPVCGHKQSHEHTIIQKGVHLTAKRCTAYSEKVYTKRKEGVHLFTIYERSWRETWALARQNTTAREGKHDRSWKKTWVLVKENNISCPTLPMPLWQEQAYCQSEIHDCTQQCWCQQPKHVSASRHSSLRKLQLLNIYTHTRKDNS